MEFFDQLLDIVLDVSFWLLAGLVLAGVVQGLVPMALVRRWLSGRGIRPLLRAALIGAPLPLCSCGVLPLAAAMRRQGASKASTSSFLVATPETGADSVMISLAMLGPLMTVIRPVAAIYSAVTTGLVVYFFGGRDGDAGNVEAGREADGCASTTSGGDAGCGCGPGVDQAETVAVAAQGCRGAGEGEPAGASSCCGSGAASETENERRGWVRRLAGGIRYSLTALLDDLAIWLVIGLLVAAGIATLVPPEQLRNLGSGLPAMLALMLMGIPMYVCATAWTPAAAGMIVAGVSPGAVLVFLLAGPVTNMASLGVVYRHLGARATAAFVAGIAISALSCGLLVDALISPDLIVGQIGDVREAELIPLWLKVGCAVFLVAVAIRPLRRFLSRWMLKLSGRASNVAA